MENLINNPLAIAGLVLIVLIICWNIFFKKKETPIDPSIQAIVKQNKYADMFGIEHSDTICEKYGNLSKLIGETFRKKRGTISRSDLDNLKEELISTLKAIGKKYNPSAIDDFIKNLDMRVIPG